MNKEEHNNQLQVRAPNWLPLPGAVLEAASFAEEEDDLFSKGEVVKYFPHQNYGFVQPDRGGDQLFFNLGEVHFIGKKADRYYLKEGSRVGFDVAVTSAGTRIQYMKIF